MRAARNLHRLFVAGAVMALALVWQVSLAQKKADDAGDGSENSRMATTETLGGPDRYLTHLSTDKPIYRPGETLYVRGTILHHATRKPLPPGGQISAVVEIQGPKGDVVASGFVPSEESVLGYSWPIPEGQAGGQYTIKVTYVGHGHPPAERKFDIRAYRAPRLKSQIEFLRDGYGPGDQVVATLEVERAEGGFPTGAKVTAIARVDGREVHRGQVRVNEYGHCEARFLLPPQIERGEGTLAMVIEDGGIVETASKTIPILLQTVDLTMYPEGGQLVAGLPNRVYFEAFTPAKKPADLTGVVLDADGHEVAAFRSEHEGRGRFVFTPEKGRDYALKIVEPAGIDTHFPLPDVQAEGVVIRADRDVYGAGEPIVLQVGCQPSQDGLKVTLSRREAEVGAARPEFKQDGSPQLTPVEFTPSDGADGVLIATVWNADGQPLAERLIFRQPAESVRVKVTADADRYVPGGQAKLTIETTDPSGEPVAAVVGLTVTDDSVLEMIEKREQAPRLPVMVLLENDVRELADAHVYLDPEDPQAPLATDLLLGTQGWRRFAFVDLAKVIAKHGDAARRALALRMVSSRDLAKVDTGHHVFWGMRAPGAMPVPDAAPMDGVLLVEKAAAAEPAGEPKAAAPPADPEPAPQPALPAEPEPPGKPDVGRDMPALSAVMGPVAKQELSQERQQLRAGLEIAAGEEEDMLVLGRGGRRAIRNDFVAVRIYAHQVRSDRQPGQRTDFTETLFWHAGVKTDAATGRAAVEFGLNDSVTSFRVLADAFNADGALGSGTMQIESVEPFYLEPKLPLEVTSGDKILLPIGVVNATDATLADTKVSVQSHPSLQVITSVVPFALEPDARVRRLMGLLVEPYNGEAELTLSANAGPYADQVTRKVNVVPRGFPVEAGFGGLMLSQSTATHEIEIPGQMVPGSLTGRAVVYPTPLANLTEALARLIREPCGCFEQTSSSNYPLVMAQQYFMSHQGVDPDLVRRSSETLGRGYQRLVGFECKGHGYEWFGADPGHEALTAYGLMEFTDMAAVQDVDRKMLERTRAWLLGTRDGKGGFKRERRALHTWVADPDCSNAYILWALLQSDVDEDLAREVAWVRDAAEQSDNTYMVALAAGVLTLAGDREAANRLLDRLAGKQTADGSLEGATTSIVGSGGQALTIETTALAVLAWLTNPRYVANVEKSINYLAQSCEGGRYGSTQSTVLALKAIVAYDQSRAKPKAPGSLQLLVDGKPVGQPVPFTDETQGAIELPDFADRIGPGKHTIAVKMAGGSDMPYSLAVNYHTLKPATARECKVHLEVKLRDKRIDEGAVTEAHVVAVNRTGEPIPMPVAIVGVPGGLEVRHDQLKELVTSGKIDAYEVIGREVVLYWRSLAAEQRVELPVSLVAAIPGTYTGPASRAYEYYTDEFKHWVDGMEIRIVPKLGPGPQ